MRNSKVGYYTTCRHFKVILSHMDLKPTKKTGQKNIFVKTIYLENKYARTPPLLSLLAILL